MDNTAGKGAHAAWVPVGAIALLGLLLAGCGGDDGTVLDAGPGPSDSGSRDSAPPMDSPGTPPPDAPTGPPPIDECADRAPEWIFCSGFEEGNKDIWDDYDGNPDETNLLLADRGPFDLAGNTVMRMRPLPGRGGADLVKELPSTHDRLFARWYIKYEPGFDFSAPNHGGGLHAGSRDLLGRSDYRPTGSDWFGAWVEHDTGLHVSYVYSYYRGMYQDCADPSGSCWGDHFPCMADEGTTYCEKPQHRETFVPPTLTTDQWYCVELLLDGGTPTGSETGANGTIGLWVDDSAIGLWDDLWMRTTADLQIGILWLSLFHHGDHAPVGADYDNVVVSTERVGCIAGS